MKTNIDWIIWISLGPVSIFCIIAVMLYGVMLVKRPPSNLKCPDGYELVLRSPSTPACAAIFTEPK